LKAVLNIKRVEDCAEWLELAAEGYTATQSVHWLIDQLGQLVKAMAFINGQMALAKMVLNEKKRRAYELLVSSTVAQQTYFAPSLAKDYIASKVSEEQYNYDLCERTSRTIVHTVEALRSCISALKEELKLEQYANQQHGN
jgi:hypothetical protein